MRRYLKLAAVGFGVNAVLALGLILLHAPSCSILLAAMAGGALVGIVYDPD